MVLSLALLLALGRTPQAAPADGPDRGTGFAIAAPVRIEAVVREDAPAPEVQALARVPGVRVRLRPSGNMLRAAAVSLLRRIDGAVRLAPPLARAHVEQLQKLEGLPVELDLGEARPAATELALLAQLGPRPLAVRLDVARAGVDAEALRVLSALPPCTAVLDFGARGPGPAELRALAALPRIRPEVELAAAAPPESVAAALGEELPVRVRAEEDRVRAPVLAELARARAAVAVELSGEAALSDVARLGGLPTLRLLTFRLDARANVPAGTADRLAAVRPPPLAP